MFLWFHAEWALQTLGNDFQEKNCTYLFIIMFITGRGVKIGSLNVDSDDDFFDGDDDGDGDGDDAASSQQLKL